MLELTVFLCQVIIILDTDRKKLWIDDKAHLIRREEKFDDLIRNQVELDSEILTKSINNTRAN